MHLGRSFRNTTGILAGAPVHLSPGEIEKVWTRFDADVGPGRRTTDQS
jgi:hypothetical protein